MGWTNFAIDTPVAIDTIADLWIVFALDNGIFSTAQYRRSSYGGNPDGGWFYNQDGWNTLDNVGLWSTWMIRAITASYDPTAVEPTSSIPEMSVSVIGSTIHVTLSDEVPSLSLFDVTGRCLKTCHRCRQATFQVPTSGLYLVYPQGGTAKRVVVSTMP